MNQNWKDALTALRGEFKEPENSESTETNEENSKIPQVDPIKIVTDKKGRNGKTSTIIEGFTIPQEEVEDLARQLKQKLGVGGSIRPGEILVQGNHKESVAKFLIALKFKIKIL